MLAALVALLTASSASAQTAAPRRTTRGGELAAGAAIDSLFDSAAEGSRSDAPVKKALNGQTSKASVRPQWTARLARNPKADDGNPPYVLIDRYGGIQRYVEPTPTVNLDHYLGQTITVRRDTGHTLLASQLELPKVARPAGAVVGASGGDVRLAAAEIPLEATPTLADAPEGAAAAKPAMEALPDPIPDPQSMVDGDSGNWVDEHGNPINMSEGADPLYLDESAGGHLQGCSTCGSAVCQAQGGCGYGSRPVLYVRGEYLAWWADGMYVPPLVVRGEVGNNGTPNDPTDDTFDNAYLVFGNQDVLAGIRSGGRVRVGYWLDDYGQTAIEGEYFGFGQIDTNFTDGGNGTFPIVGRPFIDATTGLNAVEDVSFPGIRGTVSVDIDSQFQSAGIGLRRNLCCAAGNTCCGDPVTCGSQVGGCGAGVNNGPCATLFGKGTRHTDVYFGFRWAQLQEGLAVQENLEVIAPSTDVGTTFQVNDIFQTSNEFVGGELGFLWDWEYRRWSLELLSKLGIGSTRQRVNINGYTVRTEPGAASETGSGGLLAQDSNIGQYERNELSVLPQLGVTLGYKLTERLKLTGGYTFLYWSNVVRPGDQIDLEVNPGNLPFANPPDPDGLPARPQFTYRQNDFWAHGLSAGLEYQW
ncbi:BBP7 family outer membrane beta-barrel protein [Lacipirellula sp.]|uniref:BBP7 family outer membrane beta-barrel protein n=1 Tax=Lacipirellula sp. TaxID=2691419 RepID=UPI003D1245C5